MVIMVREMVVVVGFMALNRCLILWITMKLQNNEGVAFVVNIIFFILARHVVSFLKVGGGSSSNKFLGSKNKNEKKTKQINKK